MFTPIMAESTINIWSRPSLFACATSVNSVAQVFRPIDSQVLPSSPTQSQLRSVQAGAAMTFLVFVLLFNVISCREVPDGDYKSYSGHRVYRSVPGSASEQESLERTIRHLEGGCNFMKDPSHLGLPVDFMCDQDSQMSALSRLKREGVEVNTLIHNVEDLMEKPSRRIMRQADSMNWDNYQRYDTIINWLESLGTSYPDFVTVTQIGKSREDRKLLMLKIGKSPKGADPAAVWIDGGIHAREWIAPATAAFIIQELIQVFAENKTSSCGNCSTCDLRAVQAVDWYVAPLLNPDGYEYSHTNDRYWRKNRSPPPEGSDCYGVDLNRNWDVVGYGVGASTNPCSETYKGTGRNSEPETQAVAETILKYKDNIRIYMSFHSYGQYWLTSWGYRTKLPVDNDKLLRLGKAASDAIKCVTPSRSYTIGSAGAIFYVAGGASDDWSKATAHIPYSFTVELPDTGTHGFALPPDQIKTVGEELWAATQVLAKEANRHPLGPDPAMDREIL